MKFMLMLAGNLFSWSTQLQTKMESNCLILDVSQSDEMAPGSKEARQGLRIKNDHKPCGDGGDGDGLEELARSENLLEEPSQGGQNHWSIA